ncbi:MAG: GAF domain-containing protein [Deltaproteobacteria bacterium]|nr:GAF domain-containing protein [Deltaproteobacteria bacterium]
MAHRRVGDVPPASREAAVLVSESVRALATMAAAVGAACDEGAVLDAFARWASRVISARRCSVALRVPPEHYTLVTVVGEQAETPPGVTMRLAESFVGRVITTGVGMDFDSATSEIEVHRRLAAAGVGYIVLTPLLVGGEVIGSLNVGYTDRAAAPPEVIDLNRSVAAILAANIERRRLDERLGAAVAEVRAASSRAQHLTKLGERLLGCSDRDDVIAALTSHLPPVLAADYAAIGRYDPERALLRYAVVHPQRRFTELTPSEGQLVAEAMSQGELLYVPDIGRTHYRERAELVRSGLAAVVAVPTFVGGEVRGVFVIARRQRAGFSAEERDAVRQVAAFLSAALARAMARGPCSHGAGGHVTERVREQLATAEVLAATLAATPLDPAQASLVQLLTAALGAVRAEAGATLLPAPLESLDSVIARLLRRG